MDIIEKRRQLRKERIEAISQALKIYIKELGKNNLNFTYKSILMAVETNFYCTKRYAKEYIEVALYQVELTKNDLFPIWKEKQGKRFELIKNKTEMSKGF